MRIFVAVVAASFLLPCSQAHAQEPVDTARLLAEIRASLGVYARDVRDRTNDLSRRIAVLGHLVESADSVSGVALGQSLTRARQKLRGSAAPRGERAPAPPSLSRAFWRTWHRPSTALPSPLPQRSCAVRSSTASAWSRASSASGLVEATTAAALGR